MLMIVLDATIVNVALPTIQEDLGFSQNDLAWVVNAYLIAFGGLLLLSGRIGDLIGQRRIFLIGLGVFTGASLLCALAQSQGVLIGARFVQGVGGALTSAVILGMIVTMFPEPREQAKAIGAYTFVAVAGGSIGLLLGGVLTETINWHWIFFVNIPIGVATALAAIRLVPDREGIGLTAGADLPGAVLLTGGLMLFVYTILGVAEEGWGSSQTLLLGAISIGLLIAFVARQARVANPLMPLRLFRSRQVSGANLVQALMVVGMFGMFFLGALYMQRILGYDALQVGLAYLPLTIVMGTMSFRFTGQLNLKYGPEATLVPAMIFIVAGLLWLARTPIDANYVFDLLPSMILIGLGAGLGFPSLMTLAMSGTTESDSGLASGLVNTSVQVGGAIGLAILATFATERTEGLLADGEPAAEALNSGYHLAYLIGAGLVLVAIAIAFTALRARIPELAPEPVPEPVRTGPSECGRARPCGRGRDGRAAGVHGPPAARLRGQPVRGGRHGGHDRLWRVRRLGAVGSGEGMTSDYAPTPVEDFLDPDDPTLFPRLTPEQVEYLAEIGTRQSFARGELVFEHGQRETPLYVVLSGALDIIDQAPEGDRYFTQCREGTFAADISMFTGEPTLAAGFAAEPTSLLALPPEDVRRVVATAAELGDLLLRTMVTRREWLQGRGLGQQRLIGSRWSGEAFAVRELLERNLVPFTWHDLATDEESRVLLDGLGIGDADCPVLVRSDSVIRRPR